MKIFMQKFVVLSVLSLGALSVAYADDDIHEMESIAKGLGLITLDEAKTKALAAKPGVVKDADLENRKFGRGWDYEFEIVDADGHEWDVNIDAKTGAVSDTSRDWF